MSNDLSLLRRADRPDYEHLPDPISVVDLFSGAGGLTLGLAEAAREIGRGTDVPLAVDFDPAISAVYGANFPKSRAEPSDVREFFDGELGHVGPTDIEAATLLEMGSVDFLVGGPPCQGHSDLNNRTRRHDPRNRFYERMARAAEVLRPRVVLIENVPPVKHDRGRAVDHASAALLGADYSIADSVVDMFEIGVPQRRRRHTILAIHRDLGVDPADVLQSLPAGRHHDLQWAIGDLEDAADGPLDVPSKVSADNERRIEWLLHHGEYDLPNHLRPRCHQCDHSYVSMYGRLRWDEPAQTITSGFGSMGQGRFVHPTRNRTLTPHEAARIQFFPDWFDFTANGTVTKRGSWATMIGNAVPPKLTMELGRTLLTIGT